MKLSDKGILLLKEYETLRLKPYDDQTQKTISEYVKGATIGYGYLIKQYEWNNYKDGITEKQANELFKNELVFFENIVNAHVTKKPSQNEYDALVIFCYNIGGHAFSTSTTLKIINGKQSGSLDNAWKAWNKSQGKKMSGLLKRRESELNIYHTGRYEK